MAKKKATKKVEEKAPRTVRKGLIALGRDLTQPEVEALCSPAGLAPTQKNALSVLEADMRPDIEERIRRRLEKSIDEQIERLQQKKGEIARADVKSAADAATSP